ncbi:MAG: U3 snoRNP protein [Cirrosporium novae-zelandiae]|nr:MAG: U3 snoRNP protein [Cirrosporium novae-zelandiae]
MPSIKRKWAPTLKQNKSDSKKAHQFQSFSQRVAKLKIDPIRRTRHTITSEESASNSASYFTSALGQWKELNLSENFTTFARVVSPLSGNLPQILHHEDQIMDILVEYLEKKDALALEPLLNLLAQFAHDLGVRFEKHFKRAVLLVSDIAATHPDLDVIEWSFSCLAWLFKFLSRLLVPDLRPLFGIMAPLLGRERQKLFIYRFAAEAMSFLVRKAAQLYPKDQVPLDSLITYCFEDLHKYSQDQDSASYCYSVMNMFAEAIRGLDRGIHSSGRNVVLALINNTKHADKTIQKEAQETVCGILTSSVHNTDSDSFEPIVEEILNHIKAASISKKSNEIELGSRMLFTISAAQKGSRIKSWTPVMQALTNLLKTQIEIGVLYPDNFPTVLAVTAITMQMAPMDAIFPHLQVVEKSVTDECFSTFFLPFCQMFFDLGQERFQSILLPHLQKFIVRHWQTNEDKLALLLAQLPISQIQESSKHLDKSSFDTWKTHMVEIFNSQDSRNDDLVKLNTYLILLGYVESHDAESIGINDALLKRISSALDFDSDASELRSLFAIGNIFRYLRITSPSIFLDDALWARLCAAAPRYNHLPVFLENILALAKGLPNLFSAHKPDCQVLANALIDNLSSPSHILRSLSLEILEQILEKEFGNVPEIVATTLAIEQSPINIQTARTISMRIRRLGTLYGDCSSNQLLARLVPKYCFGLLSLKLAQAWDEAIEALKMISQTKVGEAIVSEVAFAWLEGQIHFKPCHDPPTSDGKRYSSTPFEDNDVLCYQDIIQQSFENMVNARRKLEEKFVTAHQLLPLVPDTSRSQALRVFHGLPQLAEKRSRQFVPFFLSWALHGNDISFQDVEYESESSGTIQGEVQQHRWRLVDRKSMLNVFSQFINPNVLYRSVEVREALLSLLTNGDVEIQRCALRALFTWKVQAINRYEENLMHILDDAMFRDELSIIFVSDTEKSTLRTDDRPEILPILIRLLFGRVVSRSGIHARGQGQEAKRKAVLETLFLFDDSTLSMFIDIALGPLQNLEFPADPEEIGKWIMDEKINTRRQFGLVSMIYSMVEALGSRFDKFSYKIIAPVLYCFIKSASKSRDSRQRVITNEESSSEENILKNIRQISVKCLNLLSRQCPSLNWPQYLPHIFNEVINPRLDNFPIETAQGVSGMLQLYATWSLSYNTAFFLVDYNPSLFAKITESLEVPSAKTEVKLFIVDNIILPVIHLAQESTQLSNSNVVKETWKRVRADIIEPHLQVLLRRIRFVLQEHPSKDVLASTIEAASQLSPFVSSTSEAEVFIEISVNLLNEPASKVSPKTKGGLIKLLQHLVLLYDFSCNENLGTRTISTVSALFSYFRDRGSRETLCLVLSNLAKQYPYLAKVSVMCADLNSFDSGRLDEPNFDRRLKAFNELNEVQFRKLSGKQWLPILHTLLYFVRDNDELAIRSNSSFGLRQFIEAAAASPSDDTQDYNNAIKTILLPSLRNGMSESSEFVRMEYVSILGHLVEFDKSWDEVNDMSGLLMDGDEEASFFNNILHIQLHRRLRALRRLSTEIQQGHIKSGNISRLLLPLIEHYIFNRGEDEGAHNLAGETISTIKCLAQWLQWPQFRATVKRYMNQFESNPTMVKINIRLLGSVFDALSIATTITKDENKVVQPQDVEMQGASDSPDIQTLLSLSSPRPEKLAEELIAKIIPRLTNYIHLKDESEVSLRVPLAISTVKLIILLPQPQITQYLPPILTDICQILRSRAQEARDAARKSLADIALIIGPSYLGFLIKELRASLERGYQLHVLGFTLHAILVRICNTTNVGEFDQDLADVVTIILDDIFGATGQEKDAEDYISKMKEVKSHKSFDSVELLAKSVSIQNLIHLVRPIKNLLQEKVNDKILKKIDELLRRIGVGIFQNLVVQNRDILIFCYELVRESQQGESRIEPTRSKKDAWRERFEVNFNSTKENRGRASTTAYTYKLIRFSLDVLRSILNKHKPLMTPSNLKGFLPMIGDALVHPQEEVKNSALRLLATIIRIPLPELDRNANVYIAEAVGLIKASPSITSEICQAALKLVSAILRERKSFTIREPDVAYLLKRLKTDLDEPDRQGAVFNFVKAVLGRKIIITEVYEVLEQIAAMMVTNQTRSTRDLTRGIYVQFLMNYPQGQDRLSKQLAFLVKNLNYKYPEGRQSIMEAIHQLLRELGDKEISQDIIGTLFVPLIMNLVNDESNVCREMAGAIIKEAFEKADGERTQTFLGLLRTWFEQDENPPLLRASLQVYRLYFEAVGSKGEKEWNKVLSRTTFLICRDNDVSEDFGWEEIYFAMDLIATACRLLPSLIFSSQHQELWMCIRDRLSFPHAWVKLTAARLIGLVFADFARANSELGLQDIPLLGIAGLVLDETTMVDVLSASVRNLKVSGISQELATQTVRNLVFLGRCFGVNGLEWKPSDVASKFADTEEMEAEQGDDDQQNLVQLDQQRSALQHLFERVSAILRRETLTTRAPSLIPKTACLQVIAALCNHLPAASLSPSLSTILLPLHNLTDPSIPAPHSSDDSLNNAYKTLVSNSQEALSLIQKKVGTTEFVNAYARVKADVKARREGRRTKRRIEAVADPEKAGLEKKKKGERKKERRKEKSADHRSKRRGW